jgi:hypothetical protein
VEVRGKEQAREAKSTQTNPPLNHFQVFFIRVQVVGQGAGDCTGESLLGSIQHLTINLASNQIVSSQI